MVNFSHTLLFAHTLFLNLITHQSTLTLIGFTHTLLFCTHFVFKSYFSPINSDPDRLYSHTFFAHNLFLILLLTYQLWLWLASLTHFFRTHFVFKSYFPPINSDFDWLHSHTFSHTLCFLILWLANQLWLWSTSLTHFLHTLYF